MNTADAALVRIVARPDPGHLTLALTTDAREGTLDALQTRAHHLTARGCAARAARHRRVRTQLQPAGRVTLDREAVSIAADACAWAHDTGDDTLRGLVRAWRLVEADEPPLVSDGGGSGLPHEVEPNTPAWGNDDTGQLRPDGGQIVTEDVTDPARQWHDLTAFQRDCLVAIAILEDDSPPYGGAIQEQIYRWYGNTINHSRLYQNLDDLVEQGLVEKTELDGRTNGYTLTDAAEEALEAGAARVADAVNGGDER